jgi:hypothetical protein
MPVRLGAVVSLEPGDHTIELVARRLEPKSDMFVKGDVVGVFSRRMLAFDLPINAIRQDSAGDNASPLTDFSRFETPGFMPEDKLTNDNISGSRDTLASTLNSVQGSNIGTNVFSSEYLPSKVVYSNTDSLSPDIEINEFTGRYEAHGLHANTSKAILPHPDDLSLTNNILTSSSDGWYPGSDAEFDENNVGWFQLNNGPSKLGFAASGLSVKPSEKLILMMDVELLGIHPIYSTGANYVRTSVFTNGGLAGGGILTRELYSKYGSYLLAERYLDLFASFAIGYKQGGSWKIGQAAVPTLTNSFNWTNRSPLFDNNGDVIPMTAHGVATENFWEVPSDWDGYDRSDLTELYHNGEITAMPAGILPGFFESLGPKGKSNGRGDRLFPSNLGVNIPVMLVIENTTTVDLDITEIGGFVSSYVPDIWMRGYGPLKVRKYGEVITIPSSIVPGGLDIVTGDKDLPFQWASPVGGRDILDGVTVRWGGAKLSAIKVTK